MTILWILVWLLTALWIVVFVYATRISARLDYLDNKTTARFDGTPVDVEIHDLQVDIKKLDKKIREVECELDGKFHAVNVNVGKLCQYLNVVISREPHVVEDNRGPFRTPKRSHSKKSTSNK